MLERETNRHTWIDVDIQLNVCGNNILENIYSFKEQNSIDKIYLSSTSSIIIQIQEALKLQKNIQRGYFSISSTVSGGAVTVDW